MTSDVQRFQWADEESSSRLPILRARGEGQNLEFIDRLPGNAWELAKEIAAFATSNGGTILIGVNNAGDCVGLRNVGTAAERDLVLRRVEGVCHGAVRPSITPTATFAQEGEHVVLVLTIPKGNQPVYYASGIPYLRHITSSRPAEPHEVIELVRSAIGLTPQARESIEEQPDKRIQFLGELMRNLVRVRIIGEEINERMIDPWLEIWRAQFADVATELRKAAAQEVAVKDKLVGDLLDAAEALTSAARLRLHLGSGPALAQSASNAVIKTDTLLERISPEVISHVSPQQLLSQLQVLQRELAILATEAGKARAQGGIEELQAHSADLGGKILFTARFGANSLAPNLRRAMEMIGHRLHLAETQRVHLDGGVSADMIVGQVTQAIADFDVAMASIVGEVSK